MPVINPRTIMQTFLNTPRTNARVTGAGTGVQGTGMWNIGAKTTFNANANSTPLTHHNVVSSTASLLAFPHYTSSVIWFDYTTAAILATSTYSTNNSRAASAGMNPSDWFLDMTKAMALPTSVNVTYATTATPWSSTAVTLTHRRSVRATLWQDHDYTQVGSSFSPSNQVTIRAQSSVGTVGINNVVRFRYSLNVLQGSTSLGINNYDFFFNAGVFGSAEYPTEVLTRSGNTVSRTLGRIRWTKVSGF